MSLRTSTIALLTLAVLVACGEPRPTAQVARMSPAPGAVWIRDVAVLDVAVGRRTPGMDVVVEGGRIAAIGPTGEVRAPEGAHEISGAGATLVPGLLDLHGHVDADPAPVWEGRFPDHDGALRGYLYSGVTTLLDPGDGSGSAFERRAQVAEGVKIGPHIYTAGPILTASNGHPISLVRAVAPWWIAWLIAPLAAEGVGTVEDAQALVDQLAEEQADVVKIVIDAIPLDAERMSPEIAKAIVERAESHGLRVVAHIGTTQDAIEAADAGVAAWVHGVYKERISDADIAKLASYGIPMVVTVEVFDSYTRTGNGPRVATALERETAPAALLDAFHPVPDDFDLGALASWQEMNADAHQARRDNVRRLHAAGVTILAGSDTQSGVFPGPGLHRELVTLVEVGLTPLEAIRAATLDAARFVTAQESPPFGNVAVGQRADLLLVEGDPSEDVAALERIRAVLLAGVPIVRTPVSSEGS